MIELKNVSKSFNDRLVIAPLDLTIAQGETHVLLGPSGCGKTTLLRMICGLGPSDGGEVLLNGKDVSTFSSRELSDQLGYIIQEGGLLPHLSARENILLPAKIRELEKDRKILERLEEYREMVHLDDYLLDKFPSKLSGGQRQRVALMRGLILNPNFILMDEPLSALDPLVRLGLQQDLKEIFNKLRKTVVIVTHDLNEAAYFGHKIYLLNKGKVAQEGSFKEMYHNPRSDFVKDFITSQIPLDFT